MSEKKRNAHKNLIIGGAGINGSYYLGALWNLEEKGYLKEVEAYIGSSVGSIISLLMIIGYSPKTIQEVVVKLDLKGIFENINSDDVLNFIDSFGICDPKILMKIIFTFMKKANVESNVTFEQLFNTYKKKLFVTGTCLNTHSIHLFSVESHPKMKVLDAIRISISIPFVFSPVKFENSLYIDGAYLQCCYVDEKYSKNSIVLDNFTSTPCISSLPSLSLWSYSLTVIQSFMMHQHHVIQADILSKIDQETSIYITIPVKCDKFSCDFSASEESKMEMFQDGYDIVNQVHAEYS